MIFLKQRQTNKITSKSFRLRHFSFLTTYYHIHAEFEDYFSIVGIHKYRYAGTYVLITSKTNNNKLYSTNLSQQWIDNSKFKFLYA